MLYKEPGEPTPIVIEHTTTTPVVERRTIIERETWWSEPWAISLSLGAIALIGLFAYWALYNPMSAPAVVEHTTIERTVPDGRAQVFAPPSKPSTVIVNPPANGPTVNVTTPPSNQPPVKVDANGSNDAYGSDSKDNDSGSNDDDDSNGSTNHTTGD